jgi:hypothetical protein
MALNNTTLYLSSKMVQSSWEKSTCLAGWLVLELPGVSRKGPIKTEVCRTLLKHPSFSKSQLSRKRPSQTSVASAADEVDKC